MNTFIIAPSLTVHIEDPWYSTDKVKLGVCGVRSYPGINTHAFSSLTFNTGETLPVCKRCESIWLEREIRIAAAEKLIQKKVTV